jgi:hypothetical protein
MKKEKFLKNHKETYTSLQQHLKMIMYQMAQTESSYKKCIKLFKNGSLKRKRKETKKMEQLENYSKFLTIRGDKIYKILSQIND